MNFDQQRLRLLAPILLPVVLLGAGWLLLIRPATAEQTRTARELDALRPRLDSVRAALMQPPPAEVAVDPMAAFERQVTTGDPGRVLEELSRLAPRARYSDLSIDATGEQAVVAAGGPRVAGGADPDPRLTLFGRQQLTYLPVTMAFEAAYADVGELLWRLRDLGTLVELRALEMRPLSSAPAGSEPGSATAAPAPPSDRVAVTLTLFAYGRTIDVAQASGSSGGGR